MSAADRLLARMSGVDAAALARLRTTAGRALLDELAASGGAEDGTLLRTLTALRTRYDPALVAAAVTQARLRTRARVKFGADADRMFFTPEGLEQATRAVVAAHHARRFTAAGAAGVLDLCCGNGGDLVAFARAGLPVHGVDRDPLVVEVARANAASLGVAGLVTVECADVTRVPLTDRPAAFVDPGRRRSAGGGSTRVFNPNGYSPPFRFLADVAAAVPATGAKLAPGIPHDLVPAGAEAEWVSVDGRVKEAALWWGPLATAARRATLLPAGVTLVGAGLGPPAVGPPGEWLYEPDGAVIRAGLVAEVAAMLPGGRLLDPTIAYVAADAPAAAATPYTRGYRVTDVLPFSLKRLRELLRVREVGILTVKKRGSAVDPEQLRRQLRLRGPATATVVLTRVAGAPTALLCEPAEGLRAG